MENKKLNLELVSFNDEPFSYFIASRFFSLRESEIMLSWLESDQAPWSVHRESFFEQHEISLFKTDLPSDVKRILSVSWLNSLKSDLSKIFKTDLTNKFTVVAHKLTVGQGIGIHTDCPKNGLETHRLVIYLNRDFDDSNGGHLILFNSDNPNDIHRIIRPIHNYAFGFAMSPRSYHAVSNMSKGQRYSINVSFWDERYSNDQFESVTKNFSKRIEHYHIDIVSYLRSNGAEDVNHSNRSVFDHLLGTASLIESFGYDFTLQKAGLYHSIYGTSCIDSMKVSLQQRANVQNIIGNESELLAYLYCSLDRQYLHKLLLDNINTPCSHDFQGITIDHITLYKLKIIDIANSLEQLPYIFLPKKQLDSDFRFYKQLEANLPIKVVSAIENTYKNLLSR